MEPTPSVHPIPIPEAFFDRVFWVVGQIPFGRVSTYGLIANFLSAGRASRMVGYALNQSHSAGQFVPAHRVVNRLGYLTGKHHFGSPMLMQTLLENEGIKVEEGRVLHFKSVLWNPESEWLLTENTFERKQKTSI